MNRTHRTFEHAWWIPSMMTTKLSWCELLKNGNFSLLSHVFFRLLLIEIYRLECESIRKHHGWFIELLCRLFFSMKWDKIVVGIKIITLKWTKNKNITNSCVSKQFRSISLSDIFFSSLFITWNVAKFAISKTRTYACTERKPNGCPPFHSAKLSTGNRR